MSEGDVAVKYNVYPRENKVELQFQSTDRSRVELAARLLRLASISAEMKKVGERGAWYVYAYTDKLAAGRRELREAIADIVRRAVENGRVDEKKAKRWLEKLEKGRVLKEGWPEYYVGLSNSGALEVKYQSTNSDNLRREVQRLREMGLEEGVHFTVKMPKGGKKGYVYIRREGLAYAAWLSVYGKDEQQRSLAADFVEYILQRAEKEGKDVYRKAEEIVKEGMSRGLSKAGGL